MILNDSNYYSAEADREYMSVSQYKRWVTCPAAAKAQYVDGIYKPETSDAMLQGSYFHGLFDGTAEKFLSEHPELLTKKGEKTAEIKKLDEVFIRVLKDKFFMDFVAGGDVQREVIFTAEFAGIPWKCRVDILDYSRGFFCDLKTARSLELEWIDYVNEHGEKKSKRVEFWQAAKYDLQLAIYQLIIERSSGYNLKPYIAAVTKEKEPNHDIIEFTSDDIRTHFVYILNEINADMPDLLKVKNGIYEARRCEHCDYCKSTKKLTETKIAEVK